MIPLGKIKYIGKQPREFPRHGIFKPGVEVDYNENLFKTGHFEEIEVKVTKYIKKEGEK